MKKFKNSVFVETFYEKVLKSLKLN